MTLIRSDRSKTSWMSWLIRKMPIPSALSCWTRSRTWAVSAGPRAAVGSSMIRIRALKWTARAMATDWRWPPDSDFTGHLEVLEVRVEPAHHLAGRGLHRRSRRAIPSAGRQLAAEEHVAPARRCCRPARASGRSSRCRSVLASRGLAIVTGLPSMRISPESAGCAPESVADQGRLAGAVAADEADDLARVEVERDVVDGVDAAEGDRDVAHLDERHARRRRSSGRSAVIGRPSGG